MLLSSSSETSDIWVSMCVCVCTHALVCMWWAECTFLNVSLCLFSSEKIQLCTHAQVLLGIASLIPSENKCKGELPPKNKLRFLLNLKLQLHSDMGAHLALHELVKIWVTLLEGAIYPDHCELNLLFSNRGREKYCYWLVIYWVSLGASW